MSRREVAKWIGVVAYVASWLLPAFSGPDGMNGFSAFWLALSGLWDPQVRLQPWPFAILGPCSALTNLVMVFVLGGIVRGMDIGPRWAWCVTIAGILNAVWLIVFMSSIGGFGIGYYSWWLSFFAVGWGSLPGRTSEVRASGEGPASGS